MSTEPNPLSVTTVLDKGKVEYIDHMGDDLTVVNSARVSFNKRSSWDYDEEAMSKLVNVTPTGALREEFRILRKQDKKLIDYLAKHSHWTPFAHPQITLRIKAPIPIRTQFFKHKQGFVENEVSRRYVTYIPDIYVPFWRGSPTDGAKQGSSEFIDDPKNVTSCNEKYIASVNNNIKIYYSLINDHGVAPEQARMVLPQGVYTEWYWTGSLAAYARFYKQRIHDTAQWEVRAYAQAIGDHIRGLFPYSWQTLTGEESRIHVEPLPNFQLKENIVAEKRILDAAEKAETGDYSGGFVDPADIPDI
jgi:thymidylate synthase (FAD)